MWKRIRSIWNFIIKLMIVVLLVSYMLSAILVLLNKELIVNSVVVNSIAIVGLILSLPGIVDQLAKELNPKKKIYKLSCKCPNCKHLIEMDMKEQ
ncbi:hypothetical protein [Bacillus alveayuensis]|uniref:hypothetical protein n=1 Tax=Aeribacillus alveayuensis TaxID=279215 RepID=UPI0005D12E2B|nr:hypothetical protein [Bacillus alveayuensis]